MSDGSSAPLEIVDSREAAKRVCSSNILGEMYVIGARGLRVDLERAVRTMGRIFVALAFDVGSYQTVKRAAQTEREILD